MAIAELRLESEPSSSWNIYAVKPGTARIVFGPRWFRVVAGLLLYALLFAVFFYIGRFFGKFYEGSLWYPGAGLRLAVLLVFGWRAIPRVALAELVAIYCADRLGPGHYRDVSILLPVVLTPILYGLAAEGLRRHLDPRLRTPRDVARLVATALTLPLFISFTTRLANVALGNLPSDLMVPSALSFWIGDVIGILMLTPALLLLWARWFDPRGKATPWAPIAGHWLVVDFALCWVVLFLLDSLPAVFRGVVGDVHWYLAFLPIIWFSFWHRLEGSVVSSLAICSGAGWWFDLSVSSLRFHELQFLICLFASTGLMMGAVLAARHASERRLQERNLQLVGVRGELEQRNRELAVRSTEMGRFVHAASHELKNPLVTIAGFIGRLRRHSEEVGWQGIDTDLDRIQAATRTMDGLLEGLIEYSRAASWPTDRQALDLRDVLDRVVRQLETSGFVAPGVMEQILVTANDLPRIIGQRPWIEELLQHLVENAYRFTQTCPEPRIEVGWRGEDGETVIMVRDNGIGIDPRYHERVFDLFERLDPENEGRGLGLALARRIAEAQGGRIWIESEGQGKGTTVCFTVELAPSERDGLET